MVNLEALAKRATEATREAEHEAEYKRTHPTVDWEIFTARHEFRAVASPDVVLVLVRLAMAARDHRDGPLEDCIPFLNALADLDR